MAKRFLAERGVKFKESDVSIDNAAAREMVNVSGQMGVPVIVVDGEVIIGFNKPKLEELLKVESQGTVSIGISVADASRVVQRPGKSNASGAYIGSVKPSSPGEKAGLKPGDIILRINSNAVNSANDLELSVSLLSKGDRVSVAYLREDLEQTTEIKI